MSNPRARALLLLAAVCSLLCTISFGAAFGEEQTYLAPLSARFGEFIRTGGPVESHGPGVRDVRFGLIPSPADWSHYTTASLLEAVPSAELPAYYDLRAQGRLTPIRSQGSCGCCWAFATMGSLESTLLPHETRDFSENNLKNLHGFAYDCCYGGNRDMATAYLTRWSGPVLESQDPYNVTSCSSSSYSPTRHVQQVFFIPGRSGSMDNAAIKQAVMDYGAVYTNYYHSDTYYNSSTKAYYYNAGTGSNHAVCIVGWDDNFDRTRFRTAPAANGAFIIRNSWGTWWGESGYFYISYYDTSIGFDDNAVFFSSAATNYNKVYYHDTLGRTGGTGYGGNTAWFGNVYTAQASEKVSAAGFYAATAGATYELYVYRNPTNGPKGQQAYYTSGTLTYAGYHTVAIGEPVSVNAGQKFSVVIKLTTPGYNYPVPIEGPIPGYAAATASKDQSYMSSNGNFWADINSNYSNTNACLKVYTLQPTASMSVTPADNISASGPIGGPFGSSSRTYTVQNTGTLAMDWAVSKLQPWITVSPASGNLSPDASASVTVYVNTGAETMIDGAYGDTISFTNTTSGIGSTNRVVSLGISDSSVAIRQAKNLANGTKVALKNKVISAVFGDEQVSGVYIIYVQEPDGASGIRVATPSTGWSIGETVHVIGNVWQYWPDAAHATEREIHATSVFR